jgi:hypothetical protein
MSRVTDDPQDPGLTHGPDPVGGPPVDQAEAYLILSDAERAKGFVRPVRTAYWHTGCGAVTSMSRAIAETYARQPDFYGATYCCSCQRHAPVGEFRWDVNYADTDPVVGS